MALEIACLLALLLTMSGCANCMMYPFCFIPASMGGGGGEPPPWQKEEHDEPPSAEKTPNEDSSEARHRGSPHVAERWFGKGTSGDDDHRRLRPLATHYRLDGTGRLQGWLAVVARPS
jgi:hypothetical protein